MDRRLGMRLPRVTHGMYPAAGYVVSCVRSRLMSADGVVLPRFRGVWVLNLNRTASNLEAISDREGGDIQAIGAGGA